MFSSLRQGNLVYILNKKGKLSTSKGQITETTSNQFLNNSFQNNNIINITVNVDGIEHKFSNIPGNMSVVNYNNGEVVIAENEEIIINEITNIVNSGKFFLSNIDNEIADKKRLVSEGEELLKTISPNYAKDKKHEEDIENINKRIDNMDKKFDKLLNILSKDENK